MAVFNKISFFSINSVDFPGINHAYLNLLKLALKDEKVIMLYN